MYTAYSSDSSWLFRVSWPVMISCCSKKKSWKEYRLPSPAFPSCTGSLSLARLWGVSLWTRLLVLSHIDFWRSSSRIQSHATESFYHLMHSLQALSDHRYQELEDYLLQWSYLENPQYNPQSLFGSANCSPQYWSIRKLHRQITTLFS